MSDRLHVDAEILQLVVPQPSCVNVLLDYVRVRLLGVQVLEHWLQPPNRRCEHTEVLLNPTLAELLFEADIWKLGVLFVSLVDVVTDAIGEGTIVGKASEERRWGVGNPLSQSPGALD